MIKLRIIIAICFFNTALISAQTYSVSGYVSDKSSRETLIGASVQVINTRKDVITDKYGYFVITGLIPGNYSLSISYIGYQTKNVDLTLSNKSIILSEIFLKASPINLDEVSIVAINNNNIADPSSETSHIALTPQMIQSIPTAGNDIFSAVKYLPGIERTEPFSPLYSVRGGDPGENGVLLDGVMIYNPYHSSINSGIFNTQTIKKVDLFAGGYGAEFGGKNSSIMYISTKDGDMSKLHGEIEPSTFFSKAFLEFPAGKNASMVVAGRYLFDIPTNFLFQSQNYMYDVNLSYTNRINARNRLSLKYFESKDFMGYNFNTFYKYLGNTLNLDIYDDFFLEQRNDWKNRAATIIHKIIISPDIYLRNQVYYSSHKSNNYSGIDITIDFEEDNGDTAQYQWKSSNKLNSRIVDVGAKTTLSFKIADWNTFNAGLDYNYFEFENSIQLNGTDNGKFSQFPSLLSGFIEDKLTLSAFSLRPGLRITNYHGSGWNYEPRINLTMNLPANFKLKCAYGEYLQYVISMNTNEVEMNQIVDYYYPLNGLKPSKSIHYVIGLEKRITSSLLFTTDVYYKEMPRVYAFDLNNYYGFSNKLEEGLGDAYGFELMLEGKYNKVSGWLSYSFSGATRQFPNSLINNGETYTYDYTRPHTVKAVGSFQFTPNFALNGSFIFLSGNKRSIETNMQSFYYYDPLNNETSYFPMWTNDTKNGARMPPIISLDLGIKKRLTHGYGKQLADVLNADQSYVSITIKNILFLYRNVAYYIPSAGLEGYEDKYLPIGTNYLPQVGISYTLKF